MQGLREAIVLFFSENGSYVGCWETWFAVSPTDSLYAIRCSARDKTKNLKTEFVLWPTGAVEAHVLIDSSGPIAEYRVA